MTAITIRPHRTRDGLLRFAMRADAVITGLAGIAGIPLAGWLAEMSGTTLTIEYAMGAFFIAYGVVVFGLAALPSVRRAGIVRRHRQPAVHGRRRRRWCSRTSSR